MHCISEKLKAILFPTIGWVSQFPWRRDRLPTPVFSGFPGGQTGNNPPEKQETWVHSLGWEDPLKEVKTTHASTLAWRIPTDRGARWAAVHGVTESWSQVSYQLAAHTRILVT